ncbi:MAG: hydrogenase maturation protease [Bryobacteraceae bacterium]
MAGKAPLGLRVLCLGNEMLGDDAFAFRVAEHLRQSPAGEIEVVTSSASGFYLLDDLSGCREMIVVDVLETGKAAPGTISEFREQDISPIPGAFPHGIGLFQVLELGRALGMPVPSEVTFLTVEPFDCLTVGGTMNEAVAQAVEQVVSRVRELAGRHASA